MNANEEENHDAGVEQAAPLPNLRSKRTDTSCLVALNNCTERLVDIYWIDYKGNCVLYKSLEPRRRMSLNTYVTHPWIFRDHETKAILEVNNKTIFMPKFFKEFLPNDTSGEVRPRRILYDINIPIYTLKEIATQTVVQLVGSKESIEKLQLPASLLNDIQQAALVRDSNDVTPYLVQLASQSQN